MTISYWKVQHYKRQLFGKVPMLISSGDPDFEAKNPQSELMKLYFSNFQGPIKVLDIGAGQLALKLGLELRNPEAEYHSMDIDESSGQHYDFHDIEEIEGNYDLIIMQEVLEHMPLEMGLRYLKRAYELLKERGYVIVTVPNTARPVSFHHGDFTHMQHYPMGDLYGILRCVGFAGEATLRRVEIRAPKMTIKRRMILMAQNSLFRLLGFDYAHGILIMMQKA